MNIHGFPFEHESRIEAHKGDAMTGSEFNACNPYLMICARCGKNENAHDATQEQKDITNLYYRSNLDIPASTLCTLCELYFLKFKDAIHDCKDLITCSNYIERAIQCRKQFIKTTQKSKQQDSLERCLSMRLKES